MIGTLDFLSQQLASVRLSLRYMAAVVVAAVLVLSVGCWSSRRDPGTEAPQPILALSPAQPTHHLDVLAREPMAAETPDGTLLVTGYGSSIPVLWSSEDGGAQWQRVNIGTEADGAVGNSDVDLTVAPDGTVYMVVMSYDLDRDEGTGIVVGVGRNRRTEWSWISLSHERFDDRPWIEAAPDGTLHVIWNDGQGVSYVAGKDNGRNWEERPRIHPTGGSSHMAVGPAGEVAVRITPMSASGHRMDGDTDFIAVSTDAGRSWQLREPPGKREWTFPLDDSVGVPRWVEPVAWDAVGALYYLWSEGTALWLGRSADHGRTWSTWELVRAKEVIYFPYLAANRAGELAATWFSGRGNDLRANVALITLGSTASHPCVTTAEPFQVDSYWQDDTGKLERDTAGEYLPVLFLGDGGLAVVSTVQDPANDRRGFTWRPIIRPP